MDVMEIVLVVAGAVIGFVGTYVVDGVKRLKTIVKNTENKHDDKIWNVVVKAFKEAGEIENVK